MIANEVADAFAVHRLIWRDGRLREGWSSGPVTDSRKRRGPHRRWPRSIRKGCCGRTASPSTRAIASRSARPRRTGLRRRRAGCGVATSSSSITATRRLASCRAHRLAGTVRAHRAHTVTDDPFAQVGDQDLTAHVDFSALRRAGEDAGLTFAGQTNQGAFLASLEMGNLLVALGKDPQTSLPEYLAAQAATLRLIDPGGMGRFGVLIMARDAPVFPPKGVYGATLSF